MSWVAVAIGGSTVVGAVVASNSASKAADAANRSTDASLSAAQLQYDLGKETLEFQKDYYKNTLGPMQERDLKLREDLQKELIPALQQQTSFAKEQNEYYKSTFQPVEKKVVADAEGYDSDANVNRRMGIAGAAVNQQFSNAQQQGARALARYGINPNSSAFARENAKLTTAQALGSAGAQTGAAFDTQDKAIALRAGVANFGRNMPNTAASYYGLGNQTAGTSSNVSATGVNTAGQAVSPMLSGAQIASGALTGAGRTINDTFSNQMKMYQADMQGVSGLFSGLGSFAASRVGQNAIGTFGDRFSNWYGSGNFGGADVGGVGAAPYADGGAILGPGGPRDDLIDIKASNGEFMLNEGAVRHFGLAKLEKMNEIGLQNQERRGLRGA